MLDYPVWKKGQDIDCPFLRFQHNLLVIPSGCESLFDQHDPDFFQMAFHVFFDPLHPPQERLSLSGLQIGPLDIYGVDYLLVEIPVSFHSFNPTGYLTFPCGTSQAAAPFCILPVGLFPPTRKDDQPELAAPLGAALCLGACPRQA
jgi:hypothetical protein